MIEVVHDGLPRWEAAEPCALCSKPTRHWYTPKDVAVCLSCAEVASPDMVPSKRDWLDAHRRPGTPELPPGWTCAADRRATDMGGGPPVHA